MGNTSVNETICASFCLKGPKNIFADIYVPDMFWEFVPGTSFFLNLAELYYQKKKKIFTLNILIDCSFNFIVFQFSDSPAPKKKQLKNVVSSLFQN